MNKMCFKNVWLLVSLGLDTSPRTCGAWWRIETLTSACSDHRSLRSAWPPDLWFIMLALPPDSIGLSRFWMLLLGIATPLTCVLFCRTRLAPFINCSRLSSLAVHGSGAPQNSNVEGRCICAIDRYTWLKITCWCLQDSLVLWCVSSGINKPLYSF